MFYPSLIALQFEHAVVPVASEESLVPFRARVNSGLVGPHPFFIGVGFGLVLEGEFGVEFLLPVELVGVDVELALSRGGDGPCCVEVEDDVVEILGCSGFIDRILFFKGG